MAFVLALLRGETAMLPADVVWSVAGRAGRRDRHQRLCTTASRSGGWARRPDHRGPGGAHPGRRRHRPRGRALRRWSMLGIGLAIVAVVLVSRVVDDRTRRIGRPARFALIGGVGIGLFNVFVAQLSDGHAFGPLVAHPRHRGGADRGRRPRDPRGVAAERAAVAPIAGVGVLDMAGNGAFILAVQAGSLAVAAVLSSLYPVTTVDPRGGLPPRARHRDARRRDRPGHRGDRAASRAAPPGPAVVVGRGGS